MQRGYILPVGLWLLRLLLLWGAPAGERRGSVVEKHA